MFCYTVSKYHLVWTCFQMQNVLFRHTMNTVDKMIADTIIKAMQDKMMTTIMIAGSDNFPLEPVNEQCHDNDNFNNNVIA